MTTTVKLSAALQLALGVADGNDPVDVVIEIDDAPPRQPGRTRQERIAARRKAFEDRVDPVRSAISAAGGVVTASLWINGAVFATVPASSIPLLERISGVRALDAPGSVVPG